ncbi:hypothetical protein D3C86_1515990 [compost metagenome]
MIDDAARTAHFADSRDILNHADFVVNVHDGNQNGVITHCRFELFEVDDTVAFWRKVGDIKPFTLQLTTGIEHGFVFGFAGNNVLAFLLIEVGCTFYCQVIGFGCTGGENNFTRIGTHQLSNLITGDINRLFSMPAKTVRTGSWVTKVSVQGQTLHHFLGNTRVHRRGCGVVEIDR